MCGIYASIGFVPDRSHLDIVRHRGPDGSGWQVFDSQAGPVALGHRRLAIIDLDHRAAQPLAIGQDRFWLTFNGEIYNFVELRAELEAMGRQFVTTSDSEVLLHAYAEWGPSCLQRLVGMFAFIVYDAHEQKLFAARDRFGIKPLFYHIGRQGIAFASEIKQLVGLPDYESRMNLARVYDYLKAGLTDHTSETMFEGIHQLRAGECTSIDLARWTASRELVVERYYEIAESADAPLSEKAAVERFRELFDESVRLHMRSDVRVGSCLSGGLDSSSIVVTMDRLLRESDDPVHTVGACYSDAGVDERPFMQAVIDATKTAPHFVYPDPAELVELAERMLWHQDEPVGTTSIFAQWCVFQEARRVGVKVMLDGQGADEQLAGYHDGFATYTNSLLARKDWLAIGRMIAERRLWHGLPVVHQLAALPGRPRLRRRPRAPESAGASWLKESAFALEGLASDPVAAAMARDGVGRTDTIGQLCLAYMRSTSLPRLLRYEDRSSMAHSIEARVPFLDHRLVEFTIGLWDQHKIVGGDTKRVLRRAMRERLPAAVARRRDKLGFNTPEQSWFRGPLKHFVEEGVERTLTLYPELFNRDATLAHVASALSGQRPVDNVIWRIVDFGIWGKVFSVEL